MDTSDSERFSKGEDLREIIHTMKECGARELEYTVPGTTIRIVTHRPVEVIASVDPTVQPKAKAKPDTEAILKTKCEIVTSPLKSSEFFRATLPTNPPLVEEGQSVSARQSLGVLMCMKVCSEIPSPIAGRAIKICCENGILVEEGAELFWILPSSAENDPSSPS